jgi:hypothetical protein
LVLDSDYLEPKDAHSDSSLSDLFDFENTSGMEDEDQASIHWNENEIKHVKPESSSSSPQRVSDVFNEITQSTQKLLNELSPSSKYPPQLSKDSLENLELEAQQAISELTVQPAQKIIDRINVADNVEIKAEESVIQKKVVFQEIYHEQTQPRSDISAQPSVKARAASFESLLKKSSTWKSDDSLSVKINKTPSRAGSVNNSEDGRLQKRNLSEELVAQKSKLKPVASRTRQSCMFCVLLILYS